MPSTIEKLYGGRRGQPFTVLAINIREHPERVAAWMKASGVTVKVLLDRDGAVTSNYRVTATPTVVLVGRDGKMVARAVGPRPWTTGAGRQLLDALTALPTR